MIWKTGKEMLEEARSGGYSVGAFSAHNAETIQGVLWAAAEMDTPVMVQVGQKAIPYMGLESMRDMIASFSRQTDIPVCIHLDHSRSFEQTAEAVRLAFQSVMYDGSHYSLEENIAGTKRMADLAHPLGISVEGELGRIAGTEDDLTVEERDAHLTDTEEAVRFVRETEVDYLAVSIGTAHGFYRGEPQLRFDRLEEISDAVTQPIVLHGGSGVPDEMVRKAITLGVAKINVDTELRAAFHSGVTDAWAEGEAHLSEALGEGRLRVKQKALEKIALFGSGGRNRG